MFTQNHTINTMQYLKKYAPEVYFDKIENMREEYHKRKVTDDAMILDYWNARDQFIKELFLALGENLTIKEMKFPKYL